MLEVSDYTVSYGQSEVVHGVGFRADASEIVAVMGRNGMGKSTLFKSLIGILPARSGSLKVGGSELAGLPSHRRVHQGLAYVPQGRMVFPNLTVLENILSGIRNRRAMVVPDEIYALFPVLAEMQRRKAGNLSGGQQQQLVIARAGDESEGAAARRADGGNPALDHQGSRATARRDQETARTDHRRVRAGAELRARRR